MCPVPVPSVDLMAAGQPFVPANLDKGLLTILKEMSIQRLARGQQQVEKVLRDDVKCENLVKYVFSTFSIYFQGC